jgi:hypothetical protein
VCLAKAYLNKWGDEPVLQDITHMRLHDYQSVRIGDISWGGKNMPGRVVEMDFTTSRMLLSERRNNGKSS